MRRSRPNYKSNLNGKSRVGQPKSERKCDDRRRIVGTVRLEETENYALSLGRQDQQSDAAQQRDPADKGHDDFERS